MKVMKFGGTSVRNAEAMLNVAEIVRASSLEDDRIVVVVSAMAKVTRLLDSIASAAVDGDEALSDELLNQLNDKHIDAANELFSGDTDLLAETVSSLDSILEPLEDFVHGVCLVKELSDRSRARILSTGELLSSRLLCSVLRSSGFKAGLLDAREMIRTDSDYMAAGVDNVDTKALAAQTIKTAFEDYEVLVTQGFIASNNKGETTLLGFEGSDYSAALLASAVEADAVEIWTDVEGVRTADPRRVSDTRCIKTISYDEASVMAGLGASVLHPLTLTPARGASIPVKVLSTMNPSGEYSLIGPQSSGAGVKSLAFVKDVCLLNFVPYQVAKLQDLDRQIFDLLQSSDVEPLLQSCGTWSRTYILPKNSGADSFVSYLKMLGNVELLEDRSIISLVGERAAADCRLYAQILEICPDPELLHISPDFMSISIVVPSSNAETLLSELHKVSF